MPSDENAGERRTVAIASIGKPQLQEPRIVVDARAALKRYSCIACMRIAHATGIAMQCICARIEEETNT